jgi:thiol-disulfide isomerase/thioredoxin
VPAGEHRPRRLAIALVSTAAVLVVGGVGAIAFNQEFNEDEGKKPAGTTAVPAGFVLPALNGSGSVRLADLRGKPTVVNLFASWCDVCDLELPGFVRLSTELEGKVNFVGVDSMETGDKNLMAKRHNLSSWTLARDVGPRGSDFHDELAPGYGMPVTAFYDANGKLLKVHRGGLLEDDLRVSLTEVYGKL